MSADRPAWLPTRGGPSLYITPLGWLVGGGVVSYYSATRCAGARAMPDRRALHLYIQPPPLPTQRRHSRDNRLDTAAPYHSCLVGLACAHAAARYASSFKTYLVFPDLPPILPRLLPTLPRDTYWFVVNRATYGRDACILPRDPSAQHDFHCALRCQPLYRRDDDLSPLGVGRAYIFNADILPHTPPFLPPVAHW